MNKRVRRMVDRRLKLRVDELVKAKKPARDAVLKESGVVIQVASIGIVKRITFDSGFNAFMVDVSFPEGTFIFLASDLKFVA